MYRSQFQHDNPIIPEACMQDELKRTLAKSLKKQITPLPDRLACKSATGAGHQNEQDTSPWYSYL